jgi:circadian clock protein KaiC
MAGNGEQAAIFAFDENTGIMCARAAALGMPLRNHIDGGMIHTRQIDPAEISPGEFVSLVRDSVKNGSKLVVIDTLNGYLNSMPGEQYLTNQLHELCSYLNQLGVVTVLILAQHGLVAALEAPVDLSYLCDTVVNVRYFEAAGEVKQSIAVIKKRSGPHEKSIREFRVEGGAGLRIGQPLREFHGILSGLPQYRGRDDQMLRSP